jgi:hypothetical protein
MLRMTICFRVGGSHRWRQNQKYEKSHPSQEKGGGV